MAIVVSKRRSACARRGGLACRRHLQVSRADLAARCCGLRSDHDRQQARHRQRPHDGPERASAGGILVAVCRRLPSPPPVIMSAEWVMALVHVEPAERERRRAAPPRSSAASCGESSLPREAICMVKRSESALLSHISRNCASASQRARQPDGRAKLIQNQTSGKPYARILCEQYGRDPASWRLACDSSVSLWRGPPTKIFCRYLVSSASSLRQHAAAVLLPHFGHRLACGPGTRFCCMS